MSVTMQNSIVILWFVVAAFSQDAVELIQTTGAPNAGGVPAAPDGSKLLQSDALNKHHYQQHHNHPHKLDQQRNHDPHHHHEHHRHHNKVSPHASHQSRRRSQKVPRRVYIDLGANWANTLRLYEDIADKTEVAKNSWEIYAFEASPFIQPYLENFTAFLNGEREQPVITVPPSGSSTHLLQYASRYGCDPKLATEKVRDCMFEVFKEPLTQLHDDPKLRVRSLIDDRLAMADAPPSATVAARFVSVPAAAGAEDGTLQLGKVSVEQTISGGSTSWPAKGLKREVPLVNVVSWLVRHFHKDDYVVVKMDIEGAEFPILEELVDGGNGDLIDLLFMECHVGGRRFWFDDPVPAAHDGGVGDCDFLRSKLKKQGIQFFEEGGDDYGGWDHHSPMPQLCVEGW